MTDKKRGKKMIAPVTQEKTVKRIMSMTSQSLREECLKIHAFLAEIQSVATEMDKKSIKEIQVNGNKMTDRVTIELRRFLGQVMKGLASAKASRI